jgi:hypothetical protein
MILATEYAHGGTLAEFEKKLRASKKMLKKSITKNLE